jgi:hypothetical protein
MTLVRPQWGQPAADSCAVHSMSTRESQSRGAMMRRAIFALLALLGSVSSASAIVFSGPSYTPPGGASCILTGTAGLAGGATWTCTQTVANYSNLYIGIKNNNVPAGTSPQGESMDTNAPSGAEIFAHSSTGATAIVYTGTTQVWNAVTGAFQAVDTRLTLTFTGTGSMVTDATTMALSNANGAVHALWRTTAAAFTVNALIEARDGVGAFGPALPYFGTSSPSVHGKNTRDVTDRDVAHVDIGFYYSTCGDGTPDPNFSAEQCDLGGGNGSGTTCCTSLCQFRAGGQTCRAALNECDVTETCTGSAATCPADVVDPNGTPCTDDGNVCTNDVCNGAIGAPACVHPNNSAPCNDGLFCNGADTCTGGSCTIHVGDPCDGPDGDGDCSETCDEGADNCDGNDTNGSACTDSVFCNGTDTCSSGLCDVHSGDPCDGPDGDLDCSETCDEGAANCNGADPDGGTCRADAGECDVEETCLGGVCPADGFESNGTPCGSPTDTDCDNPDTCDGNNVCLSNLEANGFPCGDPSDTDCTDPDTCDGAGTCEDNHEPGSTVCRAASAGQECDAVEFCDGAGNCPADGVLPLNTVCRGVAGGCDVEEVCDGVDSDCPPDLFESSATVCRPDTGDCDVGENCPGDGPNCPPDDFEPSGTACGSPGDTDCDNPDTCDGSNNCQSNNEPLGTTCTSDGETCTVDECDGAATCTHLAGNLGVECRAASAGQECDEPEECDGIATTCPADGVKPLNTVCRPDAGDCDTEEVCDGVSSDCPADVVEPDGTPCGDPSDTDCTDPDTCLAGACDGNHEPTSVECRAASAGQACDAAENCDGAGNCPADAPALSGTICRPAVGDCDVAETCDGASFDCPAIDGKSTGICRPAAGVCDLPESCDGVSDDCPALDVKSTAECRPAANQCDMAEDCDGINDACPTDVFQPNGTPCPDLLYCNGAETCQTGICSAGADPCPAFCDEPTDMCLASSCATAPLGGCRTSEKGLLLIKNKDTDDSKDRLVWKWIKGQTTSQMEFGDPTMTAHYGLCIYDAGNNLVGTMDVPPSSLWVPISDKGYKYFDLSATNDGAFKIKLKGSTKPKAKALVKGRGVGLPDPINTMALALPVKVQLLNNENGICFETNFNTAKVNTTAKFKAKSP